MDIGCIVLAGGKGQRLGRNKALETINGISLLQRAVFQLSSFNRNIIVVTAKQQSFPGLNDYPELRIVTDTYQGKGPLGGIYTGLVASDSLYNIIVACDMPFLNPGLLRYMIQIATDFDLVVNRIGNMLEPLHAVYSKNCIPAIEKLLKQGTLGVDQLFTLVKARYVEAEEINKFDPKHMSFFNINTEADLETARKLSKEL